MLRNISDLGQGEGRVVSPSRRHPQGQPASHSAALAATSPSRKLFCSAPPTASPTAPVSSKSDHALEHLRVRIDWQDLDVEGVYQFALDKNVTVQDAGILKELQVAGPELSTLTESLLESCGVSQHSARMLVNAVQAQQPVVRSLGVRASSGHFFANRDGQIAKLFALNAKNNWMAGQCDYSAFTFAACLHLDGAGKTTLGQVYLDQLKTDAVRDAVKQELEVLPRTGHGSTQSLVQYGLDQLDEIQNQVVSLTISAGVTFSTTMDVLFRELNHLLLETVEQSTNMAHQDTLDQLDRIRKRHPVYLMIDGCEAMPFAEFLQLRKWLADQFYGRWALQPFHVYLCGGPFHLDSAPATKCVEQVRHELLLLPPLEVQHVRGMAAHDFGITSDKLPLGACLEIARVTGGFPSLIRGILELLPSISSKLPITKEHVTAAAHQIAATQLGNGSAHFTDEHLLGLAQLAVHDEMGSYRKFDRTVIKRTDQLTRLLCELPVLAKRQGVSELYRVQCCPIYMHMLRDQLARLDLTSIQMTLYDSYRQCGERYFPEIGSDWRKRRIFTYLMQQLVPALLLQRQLGGSAADSPLITSLAQWMPLLFGNLNSVLGEALSDIVPDGGVEALLAHPFHVRFKPRQLELQSYFDQWAWLNAALGEDDVAMMVINPNERADFVIRLPASCPLRLVSCKVITENQGHLYSGTCAPETLRAVRNMPGDMPSDSHQLLVLVADSRTVLGKLVEDQCLIFTSGWEEPFDDGKVIYPPEQAECRAGIDRSQEDGTNPVHELQHCAEELPDGATAVVVSPKLFREVL